MNDVFERFRLVRAEIEGIAEDHDRATMVRANVVFGLGILLGAGYPGAAASVSRLLEQQFPDCSWPWTERDE